MDSIDLLAREEVFKKLNNELQKKSVSLLKQIESDMVGILFFSSSINLPYTDLCLPFSPRLSNNFFYMSTAKARYIQRLCTQT